MSSNICSATASVYVAMDVMTPRLQWESKQVNGSLL